MADVKISGLPAAGSALGTDEYPVNQGGTTKKVTAVQIAAYINAANTALSNLASTALNVDLLPGVSNSINIGSTSFRFASLNATTIISGNQEMNMGKNQTTPSGASSVGSIYTIFQNARIGMFTGNDASADATQTGNVYIESGNKTGGTGNSGDIISTVGTSAGGTRGKIRLKDGSEGTSGHIWTSTDTTGGGHWAAPATSGTVTSVALTVPGVMFSVAGSPITTSGTLAFSLLTQTANTVLAGPTSGGVATPTFRSLVAADIPAISLTTGVSGTLPIANGGTNATTANAGFNNLSPMTTGGDLIYGGASGVGTRLANGTLGQVLQANGGTSAPQWSSLLAINSISSNTTAAFGQTYLCDTSGGAFNVTLPTPALNGYGYITIKDSTGNFGTNNLTIVQHAAEKIDGVAASKILQTNWGSATLISDGTDWFMI